MLLLAGLPCADSATELFHSDTSEQGQEDHSSSPEADLCSPFCPCSCLGCHGISMLIPIHHSLALDGLVQDILPSHSITWYQTNLPPILQPPQRA